MLSGKQGKLNTTLGVKNARLKLNSQEDEALTTGSCRLLSAVASKNTSSIPRVTK